MQEPIRVTNMVIRAGEKAGQIMEAGKKAVTKSAEKVKTAVEHGKAAASLLKGSEKAARNVLFLLSGSGAMIEALSNQKNAEMAVIDGENISPQAKEERFKKIQEKYQALTEYAANRQQITKKNIEKMKKSKSPEQQALGFDLEIAMINASVNSYQEEIDRRNMGVELYKVQSGNLDPAELKKHETIIKALEAKKAELTKKLEGKTEKEGLKTQREKIRGKTGEVIPDIVKETAVALTSGVAGDKIAEAVKKAEENPVGYIEEIIADALIDATKMDQLVENLKKPAIGLIKDDKDKAEFIKFMKLGLSAEEKRAMALKTGGKGLLGLSGIMGLLAYLSWKKSQEGGGGQMQG